MTYSKVKSDQGKINCARLKFTEVEEVTRIAQYNFVSANRQNFSKISHSGEVASADQGKINCARLKFTEVEEVTRIAQYNFVSANRQNFSKISHSGEVASAQEDTAKAETCASLGGTIWGALEPFLTLQESLGARQRKSMY